MKNKIIKIGLVGFGTVGSGVVKVLQKSSDIFLEKTGLTVEIKKIADINFRPRKDVKINRSVLTKNADDILCDPEISAVVELTGSELAAKKIILGALSRGKSVITANKAVLAKYWDEIFKTARKNNAAVYFEASVCAGVPVIQVLRQGLSANRISEIFGIVNGTTNYILTKMSKCGYSFKEALSEAQKKGFAESNPSLDISGFDSLHKIVILSNLAFGKSIGIKDVYADGIENIDIKDIQYGEEFGYVLKLLAIAKCENNKIEVRVHPTFIPKNHLLSSVDDEYNAVYICGDLTGPVVLYGKGAGQLSAASAVVGDLMSFVLNTSCVLGVENKNTWSEKHSLKKICPIEMTSSRYYLRFSVIDSSGVLSKIASALGAQEISIAQVIQKGRSGGKFVSVVMMTHEALESNVRKALKTIEKLGIIKSKTQLIRVE